MERYVAKSDDGEEIGIFHILDLLEEQDMPPGDAGDLLWAEQRLEGNLPVPEYTPGVRTKAWFSEYGAQCFKEELECLMSLVDKYLAGFGYSSKKLSDEPHGKTLYKDRYQTVFAAEPDMVL